MSDLQKVKELRRATGAGFKDCNNALKEANGDIEKSIEFLRKKGIRLRFGSDRRIKNLALSSLQGGNDGWQSKKDRKESYQTNQKSC